MASVSEKWRAVVGYEGIYEVSNFGRVRGLERTIVSKLGWQKLIPAKLMTATKDGRGYYTVRLCKDGVGLTHKVHVLVMQMFVGARPGNLTINHDDGDKSNNRFDNLTYMTHKENIRHSIDTGLKTAIGEGHYKAKLTEKDVKRIRKLCADGKVKKVEIAAMYGVSKPLISYIASRKIWGHI